MTEQSLVDFQSLKCHETSGHKTFGEYLQEKHQTKQSLERLFNFAIELLKLSLKMILSFSSY